MAREIIETLRAEAARYPAGSPDWEYRRNAAWKLTMICDHVPTDLWTPPPADFWFAAERSAA